MHPYVLIDFGSTFTKATAIDLQSRVVMGWAQAPTTVTTDIMIGLGTALEELVGQVGRGVIQSASRLACSSAAGGLRMVVVGLVPTLTAEAGRLAALGAGAKVVGKFCYSLSTSNLADIQALCPDIILLVGGTDGGDERFVIRNAGELADLPIDTPIIVACNRYAARSATAILRAGGKDVRVARNVLPALNKLDVSGVQAIVQEVFIGRIVQAKGLASAEEYVGGGLVPTPVAVLKAAQLLADGACGEEGWGDTMVVDVGGATTDVHSVAQGAPQQEGVIRKGIPEPYVKRTVEGDLGIRVNAPSILEVAGPARVQAETGLSGDELEMALEQLRTDPETIPKCPDEYQIDTGLARIALDIAVERHCGRRTVSYSAGTATPVQQGKDLTRVRQVIGTAGPIVHALDPAIILDVVRSEIQDNTILRPTNPDFYVDREYIMYALGLLAERHACAAFPLAKKYIQPV